MHTSNRLLWILGVIATAIAAAQGQGVEQRSSSRSVADALATLESINNSTARLSTTVANLVLQGLTTVGLVDVERYVAGIITGKSGHNNKNPINPSPAIYPSASDDDAPYDIDEATLRSAIYIPSGFRYGAPGAKQPVILCGGTGNPGYVSFAGSWIPLLQGSGGGGDDGGSFGDPVWLNVPGYLLDDYQSNAEYVAYAVNYISAISNGTKVAVFGFSQGNFDAQWAYKYWPSARARVSDHVAFSPGYRGSKLVSTLLGSASLPPGWLQAKWMSNFATALLSGGGDSAYVPTTIVYSSTDQVVQPQTGPDASALLADMRGVGVSISEVQKVCSGQLGGTYYGHETILLHPLAYALAKDALANDGPGQLSRIDTHSVCGRYLAPGLGLNDLMLTENTVVYALGTLALNNQKSTKEPAIKSYAQ